MRRLRLGLAFLAVLAAQNIVVTTATRTKAATATRDADRPSSVRRVRGRATLDDTRARSLREKAHSKHTPPRKEPSESESDDTNPSDEDESEPYRDTNVTEAPDQLPSATPTLAPSPFLRQSAQADTSIAPATTTANTTATSSREMSPSSTDPGSLIGISMSGMLLVVVLLFLTNRFQRKRMSDTMSSLAVKEGGRGAPGTRHAENDDDHYEDDDDQEGAFAGVYRLREHSHWDAFLQAMGMSWAMRSAAVRSRPIQFVTHQGNRLTMKFKGVPRMTYLLGGPAVTCVLGSQPYTCTARYTPEKNGFEVRKEALDGGVNLHVRWILLENDETVRLHLTAVFPPKENDAPVPPVPSVECTQVYQRIGEF